MSTSDSSTNKDDVIVSSSSDGVIDGGNGSDVIDGGDGDDALYGGNGTDILFGGRGNDWLYGGNGADTVYGGSGNDVINIKDDGSVAKDNGIDVIYGDGFDGLRRNADGSAYVDETGKFVYGSYDSEGNFVEGEATVFAGDDLIYGGNGSEMIYGDNGRVDADGHPLPEAPGGDDTIYGGNGDDGIYGEGGGDDLFGDDGNDQLFGGAGADRLTGGSGNDVFTYELTSDSTDDAMDVITDFTRGEDKIDLSRFSADGLTWGGNAGTANSVWFTQEDGNTLVHANVAGNSEFVIRLDGEHDLEVSDFLGVVEGAGENQRPTLTAVDTLTGGTEDTPFEITHAMLLGAANEEDPDSDPLAFQIESVSSGALKKWNGADWDAIEPGVTLLAAGETLQWTPALNASGSGLDAFTVRAYDGVLASVTAVQVKIDVAAVADEPELFGDTSVESVGDGAIGLLMGAALVDLDESESLQIEVAGVPDGWALSAGVFDSDTNIYTLTPDQLSGLTITPEAGAVGSLLLTFTAIATEGGNGSTASKSLAVQVTVDQLGTVTGKVIDGYIAGATVFADANLNDVWDAGEAKATTDASGNFVLAGGSGPLLMHGGIDVSTGLAFEGVLRAPEGSTVVTPLTTLVVALVESNPEIDVAAATSMVLSAFDLDPETDLLNLDPVAVVLAGGDDAALAAAVLGAGIQVQNAIVQVSALLGGAGAEDAATLVVDALAGLIANLEEGVPLSLSDSAIAQALIESAAGESELAPEVIDAAAALLATVNAQIDAALAANEDVLTELAKVAVVAQGEQFTSDLASVGAANDAATITEEGYTDALLTQIEAAEVGDVSGGINGTLGNDTLNGTSGNDAISGLSGNDLLIGDAGNDTLFGGLGNDTLRGGPGNDVLDGGVLSKQITPSDFADIDYADYRFAGGPVTVNLVTGIAQDGEGGADTLIGIEGVIGSPFADALIGSALFAELFYGGAGHDTIDGGLGFDRASYTFASTGVEVVLGSLIPSAPNSAGSVTGDASVGTDTLIGVEMITGTQFDDTFTASGFSSPSVPGGLSIPFNDFEGLGGNDIITGNGATRISYVSAPAAVNVDLASGIAQDGYGTTDLFSGVNTARGSAFGDTLTGGSLNEGFEGRGGNDTIDGGGGFDTARYASDGPISRGVSVNLAAGTVEGDAVYTGIDTLRSIEGINGSALDDVYDATGFGLEGDNVGSFGTFNQFEGAGGDDLIIGNGSTRIIYAVFSQEGVTVDMMNGVTTGGPSVGTDTFSGVNGVSGSNFNDLLIGGLGNDELFGGPGADTLRGGPGSDTLDGQGGLDLLDLSNGTGSINFTLVQAGGATVDLSAIGLGIDTYMNMEGVIGTAYDDTITGSNSDDTLVGGLGNDTLRGDLGNDVLNGGILSQFVTVDDFRDNDRADYSTAAGAVTVNLALGNALDGAGGTDTLSGIEGVVGSSYDDQLIGSSTTYAESFAPGAGNDTINGGGLFDRVLYNDATGSIEVFLGSGNPPLPNANGTVTGNPSDDADTLIDVEQIVGTPFNDTFTASGFVSASALGGLLSTFNEFEGGPGDDTIIGNGSTRASYVSAPGPVTVNLTGPDPERGGSLGTATGDGNDALYGINAVRGSNYGDTFFGGTTGGSQSWEGRSGNDTINGGPGYDQARYALDGPISVGITVNLAAGTVVGDSMYTGTDTLRQVEAVQGSVLDDVYDARGFGTGSVNAGSLGTFNEFEGMTGDDAIYGNGNTRISYITAREGVAVNLATGIATGGPSVGTDTILTPVSSVNAVRGSNFDDLLIGSSNGTLVAEVWQGRGGNDTIIGGGGGDHVQYNEDFTSAGIDASIKSGTTNTWIVTGDLAIGTDELVDVFSIHGTAFDDTYDATGYSSASSGFGTFNQFEGGPGNDTIIGNGNTRLTFLNTSASGIEVIFTSVGTGTVTGATIGTDTFTGVSAIRASNFGDTLIGSAGADNFLAMGGNDVLRGGSGDDLLDGGDGIDLLDFSDATAGFSFALIQSGALSVASLPGLGTDQYRNQEGVIGSANADNISGSGANDSLIGGAGNDTLIGGAGNDSLYGGAGNDTLIAGSMNATGLEIIDGGDGIDTYDRSEVPSNLSVVVDLAAGTNPAGAGVRQIVNIENVIGGQGNDHIRGDANANRLDGNSGNDLIEGLDGNDTLIGGAGDDTLLGGAGNDTLEGGSGSDVLYGGDGDDWLIPGEGFNIIDGGAGVDTLDLSAKGGASHISLLNNSFPSSFDTVYNVENVIGSNGWDIIQGDYGPNYLNGGAGNDNLQGEGGNDILVGGPGDDWMSGGDGADTFVWQNGDQGSGTPAVDTITDFDPTLASDTDVLDLSDLLADESQATLENYLQIELIGGDTHIEIKSAGTGDVDQKIVLSGVDLTSIGNDTDIISALVASGKLITD